MCQLFETLCVEMGRVLNIEYHQQRISGNISLQISDYIDTITLPTDDYTYKLRISYDMCGFISHTLNRYEPLIITSLQMIEVDATFDYSKKWEDRSRLEALRAQKGECDDVLIVQNGFVTDTSFCNILFKDSVAGCWVTSSTYLLQGTCRERLLDSGIVTVRDITISELYCYSHFMLINSMLDFDTRRAVEINTIHEIL